MNKKNIFKKENIIIFLSWFAVISFIVLIIFLLTKKEHDVERKVGEIADKYIVQVKEDGYLTKETEAEIKNDLYNNGFKNFYIYGTDKENPKNKLVYLEIRKYNPFDLFTINYDIFKIAEK